MTEAVQAEKPRLSFNAFGERLLRHILTPELLVQELLASIPVDGLQAREQVDGYAVEYRAAVTQVSAVREELRDAEGRLTAFRFRYTVAFKLKLSVDILQAVPIPLPNLHEVFDVSGLIPVLLDVGLHEPLVLCADYEPLREEQLVLSTEKGQWHDVALRFGKLEDKVRRKIVERVNAMLADSGPDRMIDLGAMVDGVLRSRVEQRSAAAVSAGNHPPA